MTRPTEPDEILAMPGTERDAYAAEVCMGWRKTPKHILAIDCDDVICWTDDNDNVIHLMGSWQPSQPTEKGRAQCLQLMFDFGIIRLWEDYDLLGFHYTSKNTPIKPHVWEWDGQQEHSAQDCIVTTAILCALTEKEK